MEYDDPILKLQIPIHFIDTHGTKVLQNRAVEATDQGVREIGHEKPVAVSSHLEGQQAIGEGTSQTWVSRSGFGRSLQGASLKDTSPSGRGRAKPPYRDDDSRTSRRREHDPCWTARQRCWLSGWPPFAIAYFRSARKLMTRPVGV